MSLVRNKYLANTAQLLTRIIQHDAFFIVILILFVLQMIWVALSANYPGLFDEEYHLGIIDIYSRQLSPFIMMQPPEAAFHGDITRYGSYLFHYIMSFPYWLITQFTSDIQTIVVSLRLLCISLVTIGVVMFRAFLLRAGIGEFISYLAIAIFTSIPLVPFALAQLNYDSLAFLLVPLILYTALRSTENNKYQLVWATTLLTISALSCLVKFTMLPIAFASVLWAAIIIIRRHKNKTINHLKSQFKKSPRILLFVVISFFIIAVGLFIERYGTNIALYRAIEPKCDQVQSRNDCYQYTVWRRDTTWQADNERKNTPRNNPAVYTATYWVPHIFDDFFVTGAFVYPDDRPLEIRYLPSGEGSLQANKSSVILNYGGWVLLVVSLIVLALSWRRLPYRRIRYLILMIVVIYATSLWLRNYTDYLRIGAGTAAQGRYFIPLLIPIFAIIGTAYGQILKRLRYKIIFVVMSAILISQGGGILTYISRSNSSWYWQSNNRTITQINSNSKKTLNVFQVFKSP